MVALTSAGARRLPRDHSRLLLPLSELDYRATRSGGPGGQHVNTSSTRIELWWDIAASPTLTRRSSGRGCSSRLATRLDGEGRLRIVASESRSQLRNREAATERLREVVAAALVVAEAAQADQAEPRGEGGAAGGQAPPFGHQARAPCAADTTTSGKPTLRAGRKAGMQLPIGVSPSHARGRRGRSPPARASHRGTSTAAASSSASATTRWPSSATPAPRRRSRARSSFGFPRRQRVTYTADAGLAGRGAELRRGDGSAGRRAPWRPSRAEAPSGSAATRRRCRSPWATAPATIKVAARPGSMPLAAFSHALVEQAILQARRDRTGQRRVRLGRRRGIQGVSRVRDPKAATGRWWSGSSTRRRWSRWTDRAASSRSTAEPPPRRWRCSG